MQYKLTLGTFLIGTAIVVACAVIVAFSRQIADFLGGSYYDTQNFKKWGGIGILFGIFVMLNLHTFILYGIVSLFFKK